MRIHLKPKRYPIIGEYRVKHRFALFPIWIGREIRWLEWVTIRQRFEEFEDGDYWHNISFIIEE